MTKQHTPPSGNRQAGADEQLTEEVTPQMIEAGADVLCELGKFLDQHALAKRVYIAMSAARERNASTLPYIIRRCELERIPYVLTAVPGKGYFVRHMKGA